MTVAEIEPICRQFCAGQAHERRACQMPSELLPLIAALQANETATLVEIGTRLGGTAVLFALAGFQVASNRSGVACPRAGRVGTQPAGTQP